MTLLSRLAASAIKTGLRATFKLPGTLPLPLSLLRRGMAQGRHGLRIRREAGISSDSTGGVPGLLITPPGPASAVVLPLHGGAFFAGSPETHRGLGGELAVRAQAAVPLPDYRLAPEHRWPAAPDDALAVYQGLLAAGHAAARIVVSGDSCGANLALGLALRLRELGLPQPAGLVLLSPFVDLTLGNPSVTNLAERDPMLTAHVLRRGGDAWRGPLAADDPRVSPAFADLAGLPPLLIQVGSEEILLDDALRLAERARADGVTVDCHVHAGLWHDFQLFAPLLPEAGQALAAIATFIRQRTGTA